MPNNDPYVYILTKYNGYLAPIKQYGPIVHPAKVKKSEANALMMSGCPVVIYDPETKTSYPLTFENSNQSVKEAVRKIEKPIEATILKGAPKGAGDFGMSSNKVVEPQIKIEVKTEEEPVEVTPAEDTEAPTETVVTKVPLTDLLANPKLTEADVKWQNYTKAERRQIRNHINSLKGSLESAT